jgi:hypothetical protein
MEEEDDVVQLVACLSWLVVDRDVGIVWELVLEPVRVPDFAHLDQSAKSKFK